MAWLFWLFVLSILYTYLGYPLLVALLARLRPDRSSRDAPAQPAEWPSVTLLIAAYNEQAIIAAKLRNSLALDYPPERLQILVAADGSTDQTADIVAAFANQGVELSYSPPRDGKMAAINRAMLLARGEIVVFSDANNLYEPTTLQALVREFSDARVGAVSGAKTIVQGDGSLGESEGLYWKYEAFIRQQESRLGSATAVVGEVLAIRRKLFEAPPDDIINDDFFMAMRLIRRGYRVLYAPAARSFERVSATARDEMTRRTRIIAGRYQALAYANRLMTWRQPRIAWQLVSHKFLRPLAPFAMLGALLTNLTAAVDPAPSQGNLLLDVLYLAGPWGKVFLAAQIVFYGVAWLGSRIGGKGRAGKLLYLPTFLVNSNLAALLGLVKYVTKQQTARWQRVARREPPQLETTE